MPIVRWPWLEAVAGSGPAASLRRVAGRYGQAGGPLLASGLAYSALFAVVPAIVLALGVSGLVLLPGADRAAVLAAIGGAVPPLRDLLGDAIDQLATASGSMTLLGLAGLVWGAARFMVALQSALAVLFGGRRRSLIRGELLALASVGFLVLAFVAGSLLAAVASVVEAAAPSGLGGVVDPVVGLGVGLGGPAMLVASVALVYRFVPPVRPRWRDVLPPAAVVGIVLIVGTRLFVLLAPRLIGLSAILGGLGTVFAALAWFGVAFQALLLGAAWAAERMAAAPPEPPAGRASATPSR